VGERASLDAQMKISPNMVDLICFNRKLRKYIGPSGSDQAEDLGDMPAKIRLAANDVFAKIKELFGVKDTDEFVTFFTNAVAEFNMATQDYPKKKLMYLVSDPTE
jgi:hypothetical protein